MAFRKRNVGLSGPRDRALHAESHGSTPAAPGPKPSADAAAPTAPGVRPSPVDGRPTTSTGTASLDGLLAGHAGLALGSALLIEETGTTDFGSALLRYYAAEGLVQGHRVHVVGVPDAWGRELPGLVDPAAAAAADLGRKRAPGAPVPESARMKIAYRYERLGQFDEAGPARDTRSTPAEGSGPAAAPFCHSFDLTKRLVAPTAIHALPLDTTSPDASPWAPALQALTHELAATPATTVHRLVVPALLSPALYPAWAARPRHALQFLHALRALLRRHAARLTAVLALPLALHPRAAGLTRWLELLCDGVLELVPFPRGLDPGPAAASAGSGAATAAEDPPQGLVRVHRLPVFHERGGGGVRAAGVDDDLAFTLSRRRFRIQPFRLPPVEDDASGQAVGEAAASSSSKAALDF